LSDFASGDRPPSLLGCFESVGASSSSTDREERVDAAIAEWLEAAEQGQAPDTCEFLSKYPDLADDLRKFLADQEHFARAASQLAPETLRNSPSDIAAGTRLGDFLLISEIGRGGMGIVYEARQISLGRRVALKVLNPGRVFDSRSVLRFRQEAEAAASLKHPGLVTIFSTGQEAGIHYYAMELIEGPSLDRLLRGDFHSPAGAASQSLPALTAAANPGDFIRIARLICEAAAALDYAHEQGVIHRDVKPSNLLLAPDGKLRVGDFGLARIAESSGITLSAEIVGSPAYMSPEQAAGRAPLDRRTDVYSLGATLYELLAGRPPFRGERRDDVMLKIVHEEPAPPRRWNPGVPYNLETICLRAIEKDRERRYQSAAELARDLERFARGEPIATRRRGRLSRWWASSLRRPLVSALALVIVICSVAAVYFAHVAQSSRVELEEVRLAELVDDAVIANMSGDREFAARAESRVAARDPESAWVPFLQGHLAFEEGDYDAAAEQLERAAEQLPESVAVQSLLAAAYVGAGWWERYETALAKVEALVPESADDFMFRGLAESYLDPAKARSSLDEAVRGRRLPAALAVRAEVCAHQAMDSGDPADAEAAVTDARLACELLPGNAAALLERLFADEVAAGVYRDLEDDERADVFQEAAEADAEALEPYSHLPSVARTRAWHYLYSGREEKALEILELALTQADNARNAYRYALLLYRRGDSAKALAFLERRPRRSDNEELLRMLLIMESPGGVADALAAYRSLSAKSLDGLAALFRPVLLLLAGDKAGALADSRRLRAATPNLPPLRREFYEKLAQFNCGELRTQELLASAKNSKWDRCEAHFFIGLSHLAAGEREPAARHFLAAVETRCTGFLAYDWSDAFRLRMEDNPRWPPWIPASP